MKKVISFLLSITLCSSMLTIFPAASWDLNEEQAVEGDISSYVQVEEVTFGEPEPIAKPLNEEELYQLEWVGDLFEAEAETDEAQPMADLADLFVTNLKIEVGALTSPYPAGYPMNYSFIVGNYGTADAVGTEIIVKLDGKVATSPLSIGTVPAGSGGTIKFKAPAMSAGKHTMEIVVNPNKKVTESNYNNNSTSTAFIYEARVELVAVSMETEDKDNQYHIDEPVTFIMTFENAGPVTAKGAEIALFGSFKTEDGKYVSSQMGETMTIPDLEQSRRVSAKVTLRFVKPTEDASIRFTLDPFQKIKEFDEDNNSAQKEFSVSGYVYKLSGGFFDTSNITYNTGNISEPFYVETIDKAMEMWDSRTSDFSISKTINEGNVNIVVDSYGDQVGWTAQSSVENGNWGGKYHKSNIEINTDKCTIYGKEYVRPMVAHEMGHLLGLDHVLDKRCIMYAKETVPTEGVQDAAKVNPYLLERVAEDDIKGAEAAYRNSLNKQIESSNHTKSLSKITYTEQYEEFQELLDNADVVIIAEIVDSTPIEVGRVVFTDYNVNVKNVLKNNQSYDLSDMKIRLTGGKTQTDETNILETPNLKVGKTYLFAGNKTYSKDDSKKEYTPSGAYQGVFELEQVTDQDLKGREDYKICSMNPYNAAEEDAEGRLVSELGFALKEQDKDREVWSTKLEYTEQFDRLESLLKESDVIVIAEVTGIDAAESKGVVFTCYDVDVKQLLKNSCNYDLSDMKIQMTGGKTEKVEEIVEETPVLEIGKTYLFAGDKTFSDDTSKKEFTPSGAYQGVFELESTTEAYSRKNNDYKIRLMNPYNAVERGAEGTTIPEIEEILKNIK